MSRSISFTHSIPFDAVRAWMFEAALPLWADAGLDRQHGGFLEELNFDATPSPSSFKRLRVTCRQTYVFAHAASLGWSDGMALSKQGADFLDAARLGGDEGWPRRLTPDNQPLDRDADLYDLAFVLFAYAWRHRAARDAASLAGAHRVLDFIESHLRAPQGGFWHAWPARGHRLQNPHMHLLEASLAAFEASGDDRFMNIAREIADLFLRRFFDGRTLGEYFDDDLTRVAGEKGREAEPGHQFEWAWILINFGRLANANLAAPASALIDFAERFGVDPTSSATFQLVRDDGTPLDRSSRTWPNTERIKGHLALFEATGRDPRAPVAQSARLLLDRYLATDVPGLWFDHFDTDGRPLTKTVPASTFYHLFLAFAEILRLEPRLRALGE